MHQDGTISGYDNIWAGAWQKVAVDRGGDNIMLRRQEDEGPVSLAPGPRS